MNNFKYLIHLKENCKNLSFFIKIINNFRDLPD